MLEVKHHENQMGYFQILIYAKEALGNLNCKMSFCSTHQIEKTEFETGSAKQDREGRIPI